MRARRSLWHKGAAEEEVRSYKRREEATLSLEPAHELGLTPGAVTVRKLSLSQ